MRILPSLVLLSSLALSGAALSQATQGDPGASAPATPPSTDDKSSDVAGVMLIQRNVYVPVDKQGNADASHAVIQDRRFFIPADALTPDAPAADAGSEPSKEPTAPGDAQDGGKAEENTPGNSGTRAMPPLPRPTNEA